MKTLIKIILAAELLVCSAGLQAQVSENFSDGDFTENPAWIGDIAHFEVNSSAQLHLAASGSDTAVLTTQCTLFPATEWTFWLKMSFNTSLNNYGRVYLSSDIPNLANMTAGFYLQAGGSNDSITIVKKEEGRETTVYHLSTYRTLHSVNAIRMKILREEPGNWSVLIDTTGGFSYIADGGFYDGYYPQNQWFGIMCRYTSSNATRFYADDFYVGPVRKDTIPVSVNTVSAGETGIWVGFSEPVGKEGALDAANYLLLPENIHPASVQQDPALENGVILKLSAPQPDGTTGTIRISDICDIQGNCMADTVVPYWYYRPKPFDVVISEIMADPEPAVQLPPGEYAELYNRCGFPVDMNGWTFSFSSYSKTFPSLVIPPGGYLIAAKDTVFKEFGLCVPLFTSSTSLSNEGTTLCLQDSSGHVIHTVSYSPEWYGGTFKEEGGYSLEMIDPNNPCGCSENWEPSQDASGGTPGRENSVRRSNPDESQPGLLRAFISDTATVEVSFTEAMDSASMLTQGHWEVYSPDSLFQPINTETISPGFTIVKLRFSGSFQKGTGYMLQQTGLITDCAGNRIDTSVTVRFAIPDSLAPRDVVINEVLSNPASGGVRFVELYNRSEKTIDLQTIVLSDSDTPGGQLPGAVPVTAWGCLLFPGDCLALTADPADITARYHNACPGRILQMEGFPALGDDTGTLVIARKDNLAVVDRMNYGPGMHYPLLVTREGVSLERTSPDLPSSDAGNWHSAAETAGFATPGCLNSHWISQDDITNGIDVNPEIFSPDNDGCDDLLVISIAGQEPDIAVNIVVYDSKGRMVRQVAGNVLISSAACFFWDGMTANRQKAPVGIYIVMIELVHPGGTVNKIRRTAVLGGVL